MKQIGVIIFSDSIGTGQYVSPNFSWVYKIANSLYRDFGDEVLLTNASANGRITRQALEVMEYEVLSKHPNIVVIQFGLNDCNVWDDARGHPRVSKHAFIANLTEMLEKVRSAGAIKIFLIVNHSTSVGKKDFDRRNSQYSFALKAECNPSFSCLIDMERVFNRDSRNLDILLLEDGLHLSREGHDLYYDTIKPELFKAVTGILYG